MELDDIRRVRADWVRAAKLVRDAGFDIVYVYGGHSYLPLQFLSPFYNKRTRRLRRLAGEPRALLAGDARSRARGGWRRLRDRRPLLCRGAQPGRRRAGRGPRLRPAGRRPRRPLGRQRRLDRRVVEGLRARRASSRRATSSSGPGACARRPRSRSSASARLTNPDRMAEIIRSGAWDLIGAARPSIADPFLPRKIEEGRYGEVRECIGCNICVLKAEEGNHIGCTQNATAGEEYRRGWHPERFEPAENRDRDVLVVGAGPAGMECAIVLGKRGFRRVHLVEAEPEIGGIMRWVPRLPGLGEWGRVLNWRAVQLEKLPKRRGAHRSARSMRPACASTAPRSSSSPPARTGPATGSTSSTHEPIPGADASLPHVLTPEQIMLEGKRRPASASSSTTPTATSWRPGSPRSWRAEGHRVELVTPSRSHRAGLRRDARGPASPPAPAQARRRVGARARCSTGIEPGRLAAQRRVRRAARAGGRRGRARHPAPLRRRALPASCRPTRRRSRAEGIEALYRIGDCVAPRIIAEAIFDGHRLAREIDSENPASRCRTGASASCSSR